MYKNSTIFYISALCFFLLIVFTSCEKDVDFNLGESNPKVVVEGTIEAEGYPLVMLTSSVGFFGQINLKTLSDAFIRNAKVSVSDGEKKIQLIEYEAQFDSVKYYYYTIDFTDENALNFKGETGKTYSLEIRHDNEIYQATTTIQAYNPLDSLWYEEPPINEIPEDNADAVTLYAQYTDPVELGNKVRYFTKRNNEPFLPPYFSVLNDDVVNGTTVRIQLSNGVNKMDTMDMKNYGFFQKGDTIVVKWSAIDNDVYQFWHTLEFSYGTTGNPFASPVKISGNISNGALGIWAGYTPTYDTLIVPK